VLSVISDCACEAQLTSMHLWRGIRFNSLFAELSAMFTVRSITALAIAATAPSLLPVGSALAGSGHGAFQGRAPFQFASGPGQFLRSPPGRQFPSISHLGSRYSAATPTGKYKDNYEVSHEPTSIGPYAGSSYQNTTYSSPTSVSYRNPATSYSAAAYQSSGTGNYICVVVNVGHCSVTGPANAVSGTPCFCGQYHGFTR